MTPEESLSVTTALNEILGDIHTVVLPIAVLFLSTFILLKLVRYVFLSVCDYPHHDTPTQPDSPFKVPFYQPYQHPPRLNSGALYVRCAHCGQLKSGVVYVHHTPVCDTCLSH